MTSIAHMCRTLTTVFEVEAPALARHYGLRARTLSATTLAYLLVMGWWQHPAAGPSALARFAGKLHLTISKQVVEEHFTSRTAQWLLALLGRAIQEVVCAQAVSIGLLQRFAGVFVEDSSTLSLPAALSQVWPGCGGNTAKSRAPRTEAAIKLTVRWDLLKGLLQGPYVNGGRTHELYSPLREEPMPKGSLWIGDLAYVALWWLGALVQQGLFFLVRYKDGLTICTEQQPVDVLSLVPKRVGQMVTHVVTLGKHDQLPVRLFALRVPGKVVKQRQARIKEEARQAQRPVSPRALQLAHWTILVTNVPAGTLSAREAFALMRARWQIELLFKLWKDRFQLDEWNGSSPLRILCEVYAKLLAVVVQHWFLLLSCWDDPHRSLIGATETLRDEVPTLIHGLMAHIPLETAVQLVISSVRGGCSIPKRSTRPSTSRILLDGLDWGLT